ncbi:MAG TPA: undecaprenyl-phosphate glucose phosphotransferase [Gammaproteobacteria bacterium]|nr:undecaprenyl-phosphate glucose phosphotransferase [Gammaproteobacteria bacterium]
MQQLRRRDGALVVLLRVADGAVCIAAGLGAFVLRFGMRGVPDAYQVALAVATLLVLLLFPLLRVYETYRMRSVAAPSVRVIVAWAIVIGVLVVLTVFAGRGTRFSRLWLGEWFGLGVVAYVLLRVGCYLALRKLRRLGRNLKRVALVGDGPLAEALLERITTERWMGFRLVAHYHAGADVASCHPAVAAGGRTLKVLLDAREVDEIWIAATPDQGATVRALCALSRSYTTTVRYVPDFRDLFLLNHGITEIAGLAMIDLTASPLQGVNGFLKRTEDLLIASCALILASPVMFAIALAVRLTSPGPVIFRQLRHGWGGEEIEVYKFRTMRVHREEGGVTQANRNDTRITPLGRLLRRTSLDELPQLINVLQGRMSLVGPRPHAREHNELYQAQIEGYMQRHKMRPGITGWAQVNGLRGETDTLDKMKHRVEFDLFYIGHWSLWLDLKILVLTVLRGFVNPNAY